MCQLGIIYLSVSQALTKKTREFSSWVNDKEHSRTTVVDQLLNHDNMRFKHARSSHTIEANISCHLFESMFVKKPVGEVVHSHCESEHCQLRCPFERYCDASHAPHGHRGMSSHDWGSKGEVAQGRTVKMREGRVLSSLFIAKNG